MKSCSMVPLNVSQIGKWFDEVVTGGILDERLFRLLGFWMSVYLDFYFSAYYGQ